jgi:hypothetical protein
MKRIDWRGVSRRPLRIVGIAGLMAVGALEFYPALAETVTYTYDLRGRLTKATYADNAAGFDNYTAAYTYDNADNRKTAKVANSAHPEQPYFVDPGAGGESLSVDDNEAVVINVTDAGNTGE